MSQEIFVDVILPLPLPDLFTYEVRPDLSSRVREGIRVVVQFGKQKVYAGMVAAIHQNRPAGYEVKQVWMSWTTGRCWILFSFGLALDE